ncbi:hypothetical protein [Kaarinaea lacus]
MRFFKAVVILALVVQSNYINAAESWTFTLTPQWLTANYKDSEQRDSMQNLGVFLQADYLDDGGITFGLNQNEVKGNNGNPDISETVFYASLHYHHFYDAVRGKLIFRVDGYLAEDKTEITIPGDNGGGMPNRTPDTIISYTDDINAIDGRIAYTNFAESLYLDLGYAYSSYQYDAQSPLLEQKIYQITPTLGFALNDRFEWLQVRGYFIQLDHGANSNGETDSAAVELKWTHYYGPQTFLNLHSSSLQAVAGDRLYAIDPDSASIYSISDKQTGSISMALNWRLDEKLKFMILFGYDEYQSLTIANSYNSQYFYANLSYKW